MEKCRVSILASKRLTKSFKLIEECNIWRSITLSMDEAIEVISNAMKRLSENSEPLTITIEVTK